MIVEDKSDPLEFVVGNLFKYTHINQGDILRLAIDQVGTDTAGADLTVSLWVRQNERGMGCPTTSTSTTTTTLTSTSTTMTTTTTLAWQSPSSVYSSCGEHPAGPDDYFADGNTGSTWMHLADEVHEIIVDLGETKYVDKIRMYVYPDQDQSQWSYFTARLSDNPASWGAATLILAAGSFTSAAVGAEWVEQDVGNKSGRYLRLHNIYTNDVLDHVMGAEFEVYAS